MDIIVAILIFGFIVIIHELGHFIFARRNGIFVEEFALGMGPKIVSRKIGETVWSLRALPFGGFCKMMGEDGAVEDQRSFSVKSVWARIQVVIGGPLFNILLAFVFAVLMVFLRGGAETTQIAFVQEASPAEEAGLEVGDRITNINGHHVIAYREIPIYINQDKGEAVNITLKRGGEMITTVVTPFLDEETGNYRIGISPDAVTSKNVLRVVQYAGIEVAFWIKMVYYGLGMLITQSVSVNEISGPVGIVGAISTGYKESVEYGFLSVVNTIAFFIVLLSSNLGMMNLLPIPALDGGRLVFLLIEAVRRKPLDQDKEGFIHMIGFVLLMALMVLVLFNDIRKFF